MGFWSAVSGLRCSGRGASGVPAILGTAGVASARVLFFLLPAYTKPQIAEVRGDTSTSPTHPTKVCRISAEIDLELRIFIMGVPCAIYTIITEI